MNRLIFTLIIGLFSLSLYPQKGVELDRSVVENSTRQSQWIYTGGSMNIEIYKNASNIYHNTNNNAIQQNINNSKTINIKTPQNQKEDLPGEVRKNHEFIENYKKTLNYGWN